VVDLNMGADTDPTPEELRRLAAESDDFTAVFTRVNPAGRIVRDAKFYRDAGTVDIAAGLFADDFAEVQTGLCAMLRGQVKTVDDFEEASTPYDDQWATTTLADYRRRVDGGESTGQFTLYGSWDTGDGPRRYLKRINAVNAEHAELLTVVDKSIGVFLVAGVVAGWVPDEQVDAVWATPDGQVPVVSAPQPWWRRLVRP
jgi:hypothetical protein